MVEINLKYLGNLNVEAVHEPSQKRITTAAPVDNQGDGSSFSPTDLLATSLASCILTIMGIKSRDRELSIEGTKIRLFKHMVTEPRRIGKLELHFTFPEGIGVKDQDFLKNVAKTCPVCESISPAIELDFQFDFTL